MQNRGFRILLSVVSGVLLSLAWLKFPGWILFVSFLPLLLLDDFFRKEKKHFKGVSFWGHTYLAFIIWNGLTTWWVLHATLFGAIVIVFLNSFLMSLVWWLAHTSRRMMAPRLGYIALVVFWLSFEYFHFHWQIEWPWLHLGNGFANNIKMVQWYEFTGTLGGSLWVLVINILIYHILKTFAVKPAVKPALWPTIGLLILVFSPVVYSNVRYNTYHETGETSNISIVQPNINPYDERYDEEASFEKMRKFINLANSVVDGNTDYLVGPETVFEQHWDEEILKQYPLFKILESFTNGNPQVNLIIGASTYKKFKPGEKLSSTARTFENGVSYDRYNTALMLNTKKDVQIYHKSILVTGVEKMPFRGLTKFFEKFIVNLGGTTGSLGKQGEPLNFIANDGLAVAPVICYESIFGEYITKYVRKGAEMIFIITNDGWWKNTPGYKQHLSFARLRAIETRRSIARSANTGISCFINQRGDILQQTQWWVDDAIKGELKANDKITFYVKYGDYLARVSLFLGALLILYMISSALRGRQ